MKLSQLTDLLQSHPEKPFRLILPGNNLMPISFHITEVGHVTKTFLDCGGKLHAVQACLLQAWLGHDTEHRLSAGKIASVLGLAKAKGVLPAGQDLDVEIEYEDAALSQYTVAQAIVTDSTVVLRLDAKHTDCLAKESCLPSALPMAAGTANLAASGCGPDCC